MLVLAQIGNVLDCALHGANECAYLGNISLD